MTARIVNWNGGSLSYCQHVPLSSFAGRSTWTPKDLQTIGRCSLRQGRVVSFMNIGSADTHGKLHAKKQVPAAGPSQDANTRDHTPSRSRERQSVSPSAGQKHQSSTPDNSPVAQRQARQSSPGIRGRSTSASGHAVTRPSSGGTTPHLSGDPTQTRGRPLERRLISSHTPQSQQRPPSRSPLGPSGPRTSPPTAPGPPATPRSRSRSRHGV